MTGRKMLDRMREPYILAIVNVPSEASELTELCRLAVP